MEQSTSFATLQPLRPKFSWDVRSAPWTDGRGDQEQYLEKVLLCKEFHDTLPENNSNKIIPQLQGIMLKAQLVGRARDLGAKVSMEELKLCDGAITLGHSIYRVDALSKINKISDQFSKLITTRRWNNEPLGNFESRFHAEVCNLHDAAGQNILPDTLIALVLVTNSNIDSSQRLSVLASVSPADGTPLKGEK